MSLPPAGALEAEKDQKEAGNEWPRPRNKESAQGLSRPGILPLTFPVFVSARLRQPTVAGLSPIHRHVAGAAFPGHFRF